MKIRRRNLWILLGCAIALAVLLISLHEREPRYQGVTLNEWVLRLQPAQSPLIYYFPATGLQARTFVGPASTVKTGNSSNSYTNAEAAILHIGPKAVPFLVRWSNYRFGPGRQRLLQLCYKLPAKIRDPAANFFFGQGTQRQQGAYTALAILGPQAKAAIPALKRRIESPNRIADAYPSLMTLATIGKDGLPVILDVLRNPASPNRAAAVAALGQMDLGPFLDENVTSALISCLDDTNQIVALQAGGILCSHKFDQQIVMRIFAAALEANNKHIRRAEASPIRICLMKGFSVPTLLGLLQDTNSPYSADAAMVLADFAKDTNPLSPILPALTASLLDPRPSVRKLSALGLGNLAQDAEPAVPNLLDAWTDPDVNVRQDATNALFQIPAYALFKDTALLDNITTEPARSKWIQQYLTDTPTAQSAQLFQHRDPRIREMATNAFHKLKDSLDANTTAAAPTQELPSN